MTKKCCVPNCKRQTDDPNCLSLKFFQVPNDEQKRKKWADSLKNHFKKDIKFTKYTYVCALHFEKKCFHYGAMGKNLRLSQSSCPTIFEDHEYEERDQCNNALQNSSNDNVLNSTEMHVVSNTCTVSHTSLLDTSSVQEFALSDREAEQENIVDSRDDDLHNTETHACSDSMDIETCCEAKDTNLEHLQSEIVEAFPTRFLNKSLVNIDLESIDYDNKSLVKKLIEKAQADLRNLQRNRRNQSMKLYRNKKRVLSTLNYYGYVRK